MARERQKTAFIRNKEHLNYANIKHYKKAIREEDIKKEEYYVQSVLNSSSHASNLKKEIFQKKTRHRITNKIDMKSIVMSDDNFIADKILLQEHNRNVEYSRIAKREDIDISYDTIFEPDVKVSLMHMLKEIVENCNSDQLKVFSYFIVKEKIDTLVVDEFNNNSVFDELRVYILQIWDLDVNTIKSLNDFIGSKYRTESARKSLRKLLIDKFPLLSNM